jgi:hypothetical protein
MRDPVVVLRVGVGTAQEALLAGPAGGWAGVEGVLDELLATLHPVRDQLVERARADPTGPVAGVLGSLRAVFALAVDKDATAVTAAMITAGIALIRLYDEDELGPDEDEDGHRWR